MIRRAPLAAALATTLLVLSLAACGKKAPAPAAETPDTAVATAPAAAPDVAAAATPDTAATTPPAAPDATAARAEPDAAPATAPTAAALAPEVEAALKGDKAGCVGVSTDGQEALVLLDVPRENGGAARLAFAIRAVPGNGNSDVVGTCDAGPDCAKTLATDTVTERNAILALLTEGTVLVPCHDAMATGDAATARPLGVAVKVKGGASLVAKADGGREVTLAEVDKLDDGEAATLRLAAVYWADGQGSVFVAAARVSDQAPAGSVEGFGASAAELGIGPCVPRPTARVRATTAAAPLTAGNLVTQGCLALTKDGGAALIATVHSDAFADDDGKAPAKAADGVAWFGPGEHPTGDFSCLGPDAECPAAMRAAALKLAAEAGLVVCPEIGDVVVEGVPVGHLVSEANRLWLEREGAPTRWVGDFAMAAHDGGDHESFDAAFQHPAGGPVFVLVNNDDTGLHELRTRALDAAALGFCPLSKAAEPPPAPAPDAHP